MISFIGIYIFFQSVPGNKRYAQNNAKQRRRGRGAIKKTKRFEFYFLIKYIFLSKQKVLIHSIWICYEKVMDNLVFQAIRVPF